MNPRPLTIGQQLVCGWRFLRVVCYYLDGWLVEEPATGGRWFSRGYATPLIPLEN